MSPIYLQKRSSCAIQSLDKQRREVRRGEEKRERERDAITAAHTHSS